MIGFENLIFQDLNLSRKRWLIELTFIRLQYEISF